MSCQTAVLIKKDFGLHGINQQQVPSITLDRSITYKKNGRNKQRCVFIHILLLILINTRKCLKTCISRPNSLCLQVNNTSLEIIRLNQVICDDLHSESESPDCDAVACRVVNNSKPEWLGGRH